MIPYFPGIGKIDLMSGERVKFLALLTQALKAIIAPKDNFSSEILCCTIIIFKSQRSL